MLLLVPILYPNIVKNSWDVGLYLLEHNMKREDFSDSFGNISPHYQSWKELSVVSPSFSPLMCSYS